MEVQTTRTDHQVIHAIVGDIDETGAEKLEEIFLIDRRNPNKKVIIDLNQVGHIGSAGMGQLLILYKDLALKGVTLEVHNVSAQIHELLRIVNLDSLFQIQRK